MDIKHEVDKGLSKLSTLRDEIRLQLHLASLDAKKEWDEKVEPKVLEAESAAKHATEASMVVVHEAVDRLEKFAKQLRGA
jgi:polyhydroxyalkanoate synthesis regulator phasin